MTTLVSGFGKITHFETVLGHERGHGASDDATGSCTVEYASRKDAEAALVGLDGRRLHGGVLSARFKPEEWLYATGDGNPREPEAGGGVAEAPSAAAVAAAAADREYLTESERVEQGLTREARERAQEQERERLTLARLQARLAAVRKKLRDMDREDKARAEMAE